MHRIESLEQLASLRGELREKRQEQPVTVIVSSGTCGQAQGSLGVLDAFRHELDKQGLAGKVALRVTGCHGFCEQEPLAIVEPGNIFYCRLKPDDVPEIVSETLIKGQVLDELLYTDPVSGEKVIHEADVPFYRAQNRVLLGQNKLVDPCKIEDYIAIGGYTALAKVLTSMRPEEVIAEIKASGLRGRGGAGFPTGLKWELCRKASGEDKYVICNADEGDPGAYMNRAVLEGNPHSVLEGIIIGAYAIGAQHGFIYVRGEYPLAVEHIEIAIAQARELGLLGENILGSAFSFDVKVARGAGAFVAGEETALIAALEGQVSEPVPKDVYPVEKGFRDQPTTINNVETWANVPLIINNGSDWFAAMGTERSAGTKIFTLAGKVKNTGLVEVELGTPLRTIIFDIGGGAVDGKEIKAVQVGGPSGGCIPVDLFDLTVDYEALTEAGSMMGSGGMVVMDESSCMVDMARYFLEFLQDESCGKCVPCRLGIDRMLEIVTDITEGRGTEEQLVLVKDLAETVALASLCALGKTSPNPVLTTLRYFRPEYEAHIKEKHCPACACHALFDSPCQHTCPLGQDAPLYISLIAEGKFDEAMEVILKDNPFPSICGRVCHYPCEHKCRRGELDEPVAIRALKRFVADYAGNGRRPRPTLLEERKDQKVAVIGSGPAGLACAYQLGRLGYQVTVFEALPVPGGMLAVGIPEYRLPKEILKTEIEAIEELGVEIKTNIHIGLDSGLSLDDLREDYDAVFIAVGAHKSRKLGVPEEDVEGVVHGVDFLREVNLGNAVPIGEKVVVIGGGDVAIDSARVALRLGAKEATVIYRRTRKEMPAVASEVEEAEREGIKLLLLAAPARILSGDGRVKGVEFLHMELGKYDESGRRRPVPIEGSEFVIDADMVIPAVGQVPDLSFLSEVEVTRWGTIAVDLGTLATNVPGAFAAGDAVTGPRTVTEAIAAGKRAAASINRYLKGEPLQVPPVIRKKTDDEKAKRTPPEAEADVPRTEIPSLSLGERVKSFAEVELGFTEKMAIAEAKRCLRCDLEEWE